MEDITLLRQQLSESKNRETELRSKVEELTDFIENASIPIHWVNGSGIIIYANQAELDLLEYTREEYVGSHISNFHADNNVIQDILTRLIKKETLKNYSAKLKSKSGRIVPVLINSNVKWKGDDFVHTRCFTREISDLKTLESQKVEVINELQEKIKLLRSENEKLKHKLRLNNPDFT